PVVGNMGCVPPHPGFLEGLRSICSREDIVLIFDEVMTGFRLSVGGAQELYNIKPDLSTFGKIIGGGLPVGAYGGRKKIMDLVAPDGPTYQAGTLSGNPLAMAAGYETLKILEEEKDFYQRLEQKSALLASGIEDCIKQLGLPLTANRVGSMSTQFFTQTKVENYETAITSDTKRYAVYFRKMLEQGIYLPPSQFEAGFMSIAHSEDDIERTVAAFKVAIRETFAAL
ncbi:MAG: aminotransferase class III-fold pyridoxal phosphate-dependent enzyme, partial [Ignavibacteriae bacterium]|nr:aminotransferase class III-fold pyridoxal phosphate-dependent enzyme [Ignavibacteriota bacterium]